MTAPSPLYRSMDIARLDRPTAPGGLMPNRLTPLHQQNDQHCCEFRPASEPDETGNRLTALAASSRLDRSVDL